MKNFNLRLVVAFPLIFVFYSTFCQNLIISDTSRVFISKAENLLPLNLDFDKDGLIDIVITKKSTICNACTQNWIAVDCMNNFSMLGDNLAYALENSDTIKIDNKWYMNPDSSFILKGDMCSGGLHGCNTGTRPVGNWYYRTSPGYIGIKRIDPNENVAGWIKIGFNPSDSIVEYAFEKGHIISIIIENILPNKIYPTLISDYIIIDCDTDNSTNYSIISISGQVLMQNKLLSSNNRIDLRNLKCGVYFLKLSNRRSQSVTKIVKN